MKLMKKKRKMKTITNETTDKDSKFSGSLKQKVF